jgi:LmbE family N-acetylglucosaminyl deacetylase
MIAAMSASLHPSLRRLARRAVYPAVERAWELGFLCAGLLFRPAAERRVPTGSDYVLVIAPHPDDETMGCGGAIARHAGAGDRVRVLVATDGGTSRAEGRGPEEMRRLREAEVVRAMRWLGRVDLVQLGLPEGRWDPGDLQRTLEALLQRDPTALIYAPSCVDFHPEHVKVARVLAGTLRSLRGAARPTVRVYEVQVPLTPVLANVAVEIGGHAAAMKARALSEYRTQQGSLAGANRHSRYVRRLYRTHRPVEVFWELDSEGYCRLMESGGARRPYRGLRPRPLTDGLAWLVGLRARVRLKKLVERRAAV